VKERTLVWILILYPVSVLAVAAGFLALILLAVKAEPAAVSCAVWWFLFAGLLLIVLTGRRFLGRIGVLRLFLAALSLAAAFGLLSLLLLLL